MERDQSPSTLIELIGKRYEFLVTLNGNTLDKRSLEEKLNVSRSTIDRSLRSLQGEKLIERASDGYQTTLYGRLLLAIYDTLVDYVYHVQRARELVIEIPPEVEIDLNLLLDSTIITTESAIHTPARHIRNLVQSSSEFQGLVFAHTSPETTEIFYQQVVAEDTPTEVVFRRSLYEDLRDSWPDLIESLQTTNNATAYIASDLPFGLFIFSTNSVKRVCFIVYTPNDMLKGIILSDNAKAVRWAETMFQYYFTQATPLEEVN